MADCEASKSLTISRIATTITKREVVVLRMQSASNYKMDDIMRIAILLTVWIVRYAIAQPAEKGTVEYEAYRVENCRNFSFNVRFDAYPSDFDILLESEIDGEIIWQNDRKYLDGRKYKNATDSVCLLPQDCWRITIFDSPIFQDGLTKSKGTNGRQGAYTLTFDDQVIGTNNGTNCFETEWYLFGSCGRGRLFGSTGGEVCNEEGSEVKVDEVTVEEPEDDFCVGLEVNFLLDEFPEDIRLHLIDSYGLTLWDKRPFTQKNQGGEFRETACLHLDLCYNLTIFDSQQFPYGLTQAPEGGSPGYFSIEFNKQVIAEYDGALDGCYESRWYQFGVGCPFIEGGITPVECPEFDITTESIDCKKLNLTIVTDEFPEDTVYILTDRFGRQIWNEQPWTLLDQNVLFQRDICLDPEDCYTLVVYDSEEFQDGLSQPPKDGVPGSIRVTWDDILVGAYDGAMDGCFAAIGFRFGDLCPGGTFVTDTVGTCQNSDESDEGEINGDSVHSLEQDSDCLVLQFHITTDEFPEDTILSLVDSNENQIWNERAWTQKNAGQNFDRDICLNPIDCYNFTIIDSWRFQDGLAVAPPGGVPGRFNVTWGQNFIGRYDGATDGCFRSKWYLFGELCGGHSSGTNWAHCPEN